MTMKRKGNEMTKMAVDAAMMGVGASMIGGATNSFKGSPGAQAVLGAAGTLYAAKYLDSVSNGMLKRNKGRRGML